MKRVPRLKKKDVSVNIVNTRSNKEEKEMKYTAERKLTKGKIAPVADVDLETPDQIDDNVEKKTTESTPMPNAEEQEAKINEFSPIGNENEVTGSTPETIKDNSQTKRTSFTKRLAAMVLI